MSDCSGDWTNSKIKWQKKDGQVLDPPQERPDGNFKIEPHAGSEFKGKHRDPQGNVTTFFMTKCQDGAQGTFDIKMFRIDKSATPPDVFEYRGTVVIINPVTGEAKIVNGRVFVHGPPDPGDTGTWEATRVGGG